MNIVILGGGTVGTSIAETLCGHGHSVCLVDANRTVLDVLEERLDIQTVHGNACDAVALFQAGVPSADLCLCVTSTDEVNLVGSSLAKAMGARRSVARVFSQAYRDASTFDYRRHFGADRLLSLEHLTALEVARHIRGRGLYALETFARGEIEVQEIAVEPNARAVGASLKELKMGRGVRVGLLSDGDGGKARIPGADDVISAGDHVTLIGSADKVEAIKKKLFEHKPPPRQTVIIGGGGEVGFSLARLLEKDRFQVVIIESDAERCNMLAARLDGTTVLHADVTRQAEMVEARIGRADVFVAATGRDEDNIVCGVEARELGAGRIMSIVRRPDYANVLERLGIDVSVSPREVTARQILGMVHGGPVLARMDIAGGEAEVLEIEVDGRSPIASGTLAETPLAGGLVAAVERESFIRVPGADDRLIAGDVAIVLTQAPNMKQTLAAFTPIGRG